MSVRGKLTPLQVAVLDAFFATERGFFLTGGGALVGYHLQHRETTDLDLFTSSQEAFERARFSLPLIAEAVGGTLVTRQESPAFRRVVVEHDADALVVDLVRDIGPQLHDKTQIGDVIVDPVEEILANKLTTLVSRQEVRDLVDVLELERHGLRVEEFLAEALTKDGGCTPGTLSWLLSQWHVPTNAKLPPGYSLDQLIAFKDELAERMAVVAHPS